MKVQIEHYPYPPAFVAGTEGFSPEDRAGYEALLQGDTCPADTLALTLTVSGCPISASTIRTWRRANKLWKKVHDDDSSGEG